MFPSYCGFHPIMEYLPNNKTLWLILLCIWLSICLIIPIRIAVFRTKTLMRFYLIVSSSTTAMLIDLDSDYLIPAASG